MLDMLFALVAVASMLIGLVLSVMLWVKSSKSVKELYKNAYAYAIIDVVLGVLSYISYAATINSVDVDVREFYTNYFTAPLIVLAVLVVSIAAITFAKSRKIA
ncbi:peptidase A8 [Gardnerella vaginalis]|uniref:peptidase A8 n=1 Tax=Gardnerella vaginalis TaxID=2702 RepID=UPI0039F09FE1